MDDEATMVKQVPFPDSVAQLRLLPEANYRDAFVAEARTVLPAEEWVRRALHRAPRGLLSGVRLVQSALGLDLADASYDRPLGWTVLHSEPQLFVLGAEGRGGVVRLAASTTGTRLTFTTQAAFGTRARVLWAFVQHPHRLIARALMARAIADDRRP